MYSLLFTCRQLIMEDSKGRGGTYAAHKGHGDPVQAALSPAIPTTVARQNGTHSKGKGQEGQTKEFSAKKNYFVLDLPIWGGSFQIFFARKKTTMAVSHFFFMPLPAGRASGLGTFPAQAVQARPPRKATLAPLRLFPGVCLFFCSFFFTFSLGQTPGSFKTRTPSPPPPRGFSQRPLFPQPVAPSWVVPGGWSVQPNWDVTFFAQFCTHGTQFSSL